MDPAGIPGRSDSCVQLQRSAEYLHQIGAIAVLPSDDSEILQCRGANQGTRTAIV